MLMAVSMAIVISLQIAKHDGTHEGTVANVNFEFATTGGKSKQCDGNAGVGADGGANHIDGGTVADDDNTGR